MVLCEGFFSELGRTSTRLSGEYVAVVMSQVIKKRRPKAYEKYYHGRRASRRGG